MGCGTVLDKMGIRKVDLMNIWNSLRVAPNHDKMIAARDMLESALNLDISPGLGPFDRMQELHRRLNPSANFSIRQDLQRLMGLFHDSTNSCSLAKPCSF